MKKVSLNFENPNGIEVEMTAEEISAKEAENAKNAEIILAEKDAELAKANLIASA